MKKPLILLAAGLLAVGHSFAQSGAAAASADVRHHNPKAEAAYRQNLDLLAGYPNNAASKTTGTSQRLLASMLYYNTGNGLAASDSVRYYYGAGRGSSFSQDELFYYTAHTIRRPARGFVDCDTAVHLDPASGTLTWGEVNARNAGGGISAQEPFGGFGGFTNVFQYDAQGHMTENCVRNYDFTTNTWHDIRRNRYSYNAQGRLEKDSSQQWINTAWLTKSVSSISYNAAGNPASVEALTWDGSSLEPDYRIQNTYNAANRLETFTYEYFTGSGYVADSRDSFAYSGNARIYGESLFFNGTIKFVTYRNFRHLNSAGLVDSSLSIEYDVTNNSSMRSHMLLSYNNAENPVTVRNYKEGVIVSKTDHYYEQYQSTGFGSIARRKAIAVFPNPAGAVLQLRPAASGKAALTIVNAAGQSVMMLQLQTQAGQTLRLPVQDLATGQYWLLLQDEEGQQYSATFLKQ